MSQVTATGESERVVVTGVGCVTPYGYGVPFLWDAMKQSKSGIRLLESDFGLNTKIGGSVAPSLLDEHFDAKQKRRYDPFIMYGLLAAREAFVSSGLATFAGFDSTRTGVMVGSGIGGIQGIQTQAERLYAAGPKRVSPFFIPSTLVNMLSGFVSIDLGLKGPNFSVVSACATGAHSIISAYQTLKLGMADAVLAGGAEHSTTRLGITGFSVMRALSTRNDDPQAASRPWDSERDGFVMSDGAGVLVLETYSHARSRGATILAELSGVGMTGDGYHMTQPDPHGQGALRCMQLAITDAGLSPNDIGYINAHATSTPLGDENEPKAVKKLFDAYAYSLPVSSTKSMHGHLLGAAGAVESIVSICALQDQIIPPTINCYRPSIDCDLDFVREGARSHRFKHALSNSFGFGGTNASLLFSRCSD